jgi:hypothetical protein
MELYAARRRAGVTVGEYSSSFDLEVFRPFIYLAGAALGGDVAGTGEEIAARLESAEVGETGTVALCISSAGLTQETRLEFAKDDFDTVDVAFFRRRKSSTRSTAVGR